MDDQARKRVEPSKGEQRENRKQEIAGFSMGLIAVAAIVAIAIVVIALLLIT